MIPVLALLLTGAVQVQARKFRVMTFNIRLENSGDGINNWDNRKADDVAFIHKAAPDVFGLQEATPSQMQYLTKELTDYGYVGVGRDDGTTGPHAGEFSPVFYRKDRYKVLSSGNFWLSETPEKPSKGWDAACRRICSWALLQDVRTGNSFVYANTHLDHVGVKARMNGAMLIKERLSKIANDSPMMITGDFNVNDQSSSYSTMRDRFFTLNDAYKVARKRTGLKSTFQGFGAVPDDKGQKIDFIFISPSLKVKSAHIYSSLLGDGRYLSDHNPHWADLDGKQL
jgi:endonuclease/exonuclease/phosphatase family metal-dependent hydrolase